MTPAQSRDRIESAAKRADHLDGSNVVPFVGPRRASAAPAIMFGPNERPAPPLSHDGRSLMPTFIVCALALHAGLYALEHEPTPVASIGEVSVSVDIVLGSQQAAGLAQAPSPSAAANAGSNLTEQPAKDETEKPAQAEAPAQTEVPVQSQSAMREPEPPMREPEAPLTADPEPQLTAEPAPRLTAEPAPRLTAEPAPRSSAQAKPSVRQPVAPQPRTTASVERKPPQRADQTRAKPQREARLQPNGSTRAAPSSSSSASSPSSGAGRGRSDADSNYAGLVYAHLARHQRAVADPREAPPISVMLTIDGGGRVTGVRLTRPSGIATFDQEVQALVRRASPLPAPPGGRPTTLSWSVKFRPF
jgi:protein TonB